MQRLLCLAFGSMLLVTSSAAAQDKLPDGAALRIGVHRLRVSGAIADFAFTPDQRTLAVAYDESDPKKFNLVLFDVATGLERKRLNVRGAQHLAMARHKPLLAVDTHNGIEVWDLAAEKRVQQWDYPECVDEASALTISPDGTQVVAAVPGLLLRWNAHTGAELPAIRPRRSEFPIQTLHFSAEGSKLFTAESYPSRGQDRRYFGFAPEVQVALFDYSNYYLLPFTTLAGPRTRLAHTTAWSIASNWLIRPPAPMATLWDTTTLKKLREFAVGEGECAFSPDGTMVALSSANMYRTDIIRLDREWTHVGTIPQPGSVVFSPDGKQILGAGNWLWDIAGRKTVHEFDLSYFASARFAPDGKMLAVVKASGDGRLDILYSPNGGILRGGKYYYSTAASPGNHLRLVDLTTGKPKSWATGYSDTVGGVTYSPDGRWLASCSGDTLFIHDAKTGAELRRWIAHKQPITQIAFSPDGKTLVSGSQSGMQYLFSPDDKKPAPADAESSIRLWNPATGKEQRRLRYDNYVSSLVFTRDGTALISVDLYGSARRWHLGTGKHEDLDGVSFAGMASNLAVSADRLACFQADRETGIVHLNWLPLRASKKSATKSPDFGVEVFEGFGRAREEDSLFFSPDGKLLASSGFLPMGEDKQEAVVRVWESASQREIVRFTGGQNVTNLLAISPDGRLLAHVPQKAPEFKEVFVPPGLIRKEEIVSEQAVVVLDLASAYSTAKNDEKTTRPITGHLAPITCLAFSPDGKFLATGGADQVVYVWRVEHFFKRPALPEFKGDVADYWPHLADAEAGKAYRAIAQLERRPKETIALLRKHVKPAHVAEEKVIVQHLRELSSGNFAVRQQANSALEKLGEQATPHVHAALKKPGNLEAKRRLETLLEKLDRPMEVADNLRAYRSLILLERINTPEARQLLDELSHGAPASWLTAEAGHSLRRVSK